MVISWDCFDTLISRYYHYPKSIFELIAHSTNNGDFIQKRIHAEKIATNKTLQGIYEHLPGHDSRLELELEKKYSYPIKENFHRIKDGDIIVSDMYLSSEEILDILRYHGLDKDVKVYSTYGKKANGSIWNELREKYDIKFHIGDNIHSDVITPRNYGINTIYYGSSYLTNTEKIIERYSPYLAYWIKYIRLSQPYFIPYKEIIFDKVTINKNNSAVNMKWP